MEKKNLKKIHFVFFQNIPYIITFLHMCVCVCVYGYVCARVSELYF